MPSSSDTTPPKIMPPASRAETAARIVSDRLIKAMSRREPTSVGAASDSIATASPVEIPHQSTVDPTFAVGVAAPLPQDLEAVDPAESGFRDFSQVRLPGGFDPIASLGVSGRLAGASGLDGPFPDDHFAQAGEPLENPTVPAVTPPADFASPDLNPANDRGSTRIESGTEGSLVESPAVRGGMLTSALDYAVASAADPGGAGTAHSAWSEATVTGDDTGFAGGAGGGVAGASPGPDLSKTNELLGQILEVLRKQPVASGASLPTAGPSLYAGRL